MSMKFLKDENEKERILLHYAAEFMSETDSSKEANRLLAMTTHLFTDLGLIAMFPSEKLHLYQQILEAFAFIASKLTRGDPKLPSWLCRDVAKSQRRKQKSFFYNGFNTLLRLCFCELISIFPGGNWTDDDAASFLRTLETINPDLSRLFTKVFDDLIDHVKLKEFFSKEYSKSDLDSILPKNFSYCVFLSLSEVVRPKDSLNRERTVQRKYGLMHHYRFPVTTTFYAPVVAESNPLVISDL